MDKWTRRSTSESINVDVDLQDFDTEQLLQELIERGVVTEADALAIMKAFKSKEPQPPRPKARDNADLVRAEDEIRSGRRDEALIYIERFLGREWIGVLTS